MATKKQDPDDGAIERFAVAQPEEPATNPHGRLAELYDKAAKHDAAGRKAVASRLYRKAAQVKRLLETVTP